MNAQGYVSKREFDLGNDGSIDSYDDILTDAYGRWITVLSDSTNSGSHDKRTDNEYDEYNREISSKTDNGNNGSIDATYITTYDSVGNAVQTDADTDGDGVLNVRYTRIFDGQGRVLEGDFINLLTGKVYMTSYLTYNNDGQVIIGKYDLDGDRSISSAKDSIEHYEFGTPWNKTVKSTTYNGLNEPQASYEVEYDARGGVQRLYLDDKNDGTVNRLIYGNIHANYANNFTDDITQWSDEQLTRIKGLSRITLSNQAAETTIKLDAETVATIKDGKTGSIVISGDSTDTVNLTGFNHISTGSDGYKHYQATIDEVNYNLYIQGTIEILS